MRPFLAAPPEDAVQDALVEAVRVSRRRPIRNDRGTQININLDRHCSLHAVHALPPQRVTACSALW